MGATVLGLDVRTCLDPVGHGVGAVSLEADGGGRIRAESGGQGRGTRVIFTVPMIGEAGDARAEDARSRSGSGSDALREAPILVIPVARHQLSARIKWGGGDLPGDFRTSADLRE